MGKLFKRIITLGLIGVVSLIGFASCSNKDNNNEKGNVDSDKKVLKLGGYPGPYDELFYDAVQPILEKKGYTIETVSFNDMQLADTALSEGSVDFIVSQHTAFMNVFNESKGGELVALTHLPTVRTAMFSEKNTSIDTVKNGDKVAISKDPSSAARALLVLEKAGWIKIKEGVEPIKATLNDIEDNKHNLEIIPMDAGQIPRALKDVDYGVVAGSFVHAAKMDPKKSLLSEDVIEDLELTLVVDGKNKDSKWAKDINDAYKSDEFKAYMEKNNKDGFWFIPKSLN